MKIQRRCVITLATAFGALLMTVLLTNFTHAQKASAITTAGNGVQTTTFDTSQGTLKVYLPDDMAAGDTISGTVVADTKGTDDQERGKNQAVLNGLVIEMQTPKTTDGKNTLVVKVPVSVGANIFTLKLPSTTTLNSTFKSVSTSNSVGLGITLTNTSGSQTIGNSSGAQVSLTPSTNQSSGIPASTSISVQELSQPGKPTSISTPLDGDSSNTILTVGGQQVRPLTESPRGCSFESPSNLVGPVQINLKEGGVEKNAGYRNVNVRVTAPKTTLEEGEYTPLTVRADGLQGITKPVPIHLVKSGVVSMEGGDSQTRQIKPSDVDANGGFTWTLGITGQQTGAWAATATVVVFDVCLQDDNGGNALTFSSTTGDYIFCVGGNKTGGTGTVNRSGCMITLQDDNPDRRVQVQSDGCTKRGSASVQPGSGKPKFTITDRNTTDNTCACPTSPTPTPSPTPTTQPSPTVTTTPPPSSSPVPGTTTTPDTTTAPPPCDLQGQVVHIEKGPNGNEQAWIIEIKLPNGKVIKIRMKGRKPNLQYCNWIKIKTCHTDGGEIYIDDWEKTNPPAPPNPPTNPTKPDDTKPVPPTTPVQPNPPDNPPSPTSTPGPGDTTAVPEPPCKDGDKKTTHRIVSCEVSQGVVTPLGQTPDSTTVFNISTAIVKLLGGNQGVEIGTKLAGAFSTNQARNIFVKFKIKFVDDTYICKDGKWVLESSVPGESESGWIQLFDSQGGGGTNWLPGSTAGDVKAAIDTAKPEGCP